MTDHRRTKRLEGLFADLNRTGICSLTCGIKIVREIFHKLAGKRKFYRRTGLKIDEPGVKGVGFPGEICRELTFAATEALETRGRTGRTPFGEQTGTVDALKNGMTNKQNAMHLSRPWPQNGGFKAHLREIVAKLKRMVEVPMGYQDETGFHYGSEPAKPANEKTQWPSA